MSRTLVVYYSTTGHNRTLAESIAAPLQADIEAIQNVKPGPRLNLHGKINVWAFMIAGAGAAMRLTTHIKPPQHNPADYDLVIIGTPAYAGLLPREVRTYLHQMRGKFKRVAFFTSSGDANQPRLFAELQRLTGLVPVATLSIAADALDANTGSENVQRFVEELRQV